MDEQNGSGILRDPRIAKFAIGFLIAATALVTIQAFSALSNFYESPSGQQDTITVSGEGKVSAPPDIATISFVVSENAPTVAAAQTSAAKNTNAALAALSSFNIASADIQTSSYDVSPQYSSTVCGVVAPGSGVALPCVYNGPGTIIGYTASQTVTVTIRNLDSVGPVVTALGKANVSNIDGPNFSIDKPDAAEAQARALAIADARTKADTLAGELGVRILRVVNYSEGGSNYPLPMMAEGVSASNAAPTSVVPSVPVGENDVIVNVSVTYEIH